MTKSLPSGMITAKNKIAGTEPWAILLDIVLKEGGVTQQTLYMTSNNEDVSYGGHTYQAFPFIISPTGQQSKGEIPSVTLSVGRIAGVLQEYLEALSGGVGSEVKVSVVLIQTGGPLGDAELEMTFQIVATESTPEWIVFTLGAPNPMRMRFPKYRYMANHCMWEYKGDECKYSGG